MCEAHKECRAHVRIDGVPVCYECWNNGNQQEREWINLIVKKYSRGLITEDEMRQELLDVAYHEIDPTYPVHFSR